MAQYDFKTLNDKEFEALSVDLLGMQLGVHIERFKAGRDAGVDGRFFSPGDGEVIIQCKHWANSPNRELIRRLLSEERGKVDKLDPHRYILVVSNSLSRSEKKKLSQIFHPYLRENDVFGAEDLNDLLDLYPEVQKRHYKLWLTSVFVIDHIVNHAIHGRSRYSLSEIIQSSARYAVTSNHQAALELLERHNVVIITGEPGVGKTTLANHLSLHYVTQGYDYFKIGEDVTEGESVFNEANQQLFYFDDFLGRNYLEALKGHEGAQITQFIKRVAGSKNKKFVLTSRSTILNQGKMLIDIYHHKNVQKNEYELKISSLSDMDKAQILYNHIWHSGLITGFVEVIYENKRYKNIINHRHFNPRIIDFITDVNRLDDVPAESYWDYICASLDNPSAIWENPFVAQQDDFGRALIILTVFSGRAISEKALAEAYVIYIAMPENHAFSGRSEFQSNIRQLTGSFFNRLVSPGSEARIDIFNPSIGDFVLQRYSDELGLLSCVMFSLRSYASLITLRSLRERRFIEAKDAITILLYVAQRANSLGFKGFSATYIAALCEELAKISTNEVKLFKTNAAKFVLENASDAATDDVFNLIRWGIYENILPPTSVVAYAQAHLEDADSKFELRALGRLVAEVDADVDGIDELRSSVREHALDAFSENFNDFLDLSDAFSNVDSEDYSFARDLLKDRISEVLSDLQLDYDISDIENILDVIDVRSELDSFHDSTPYSGTPKSIGPAPLIFDAVDDLFERD